MKTKILGILIIAILSTSQLFSQYSDFMLSDYKLPEMKRQSLVFNFGFLGYNNNLKIHEGLNNHEENKNSYTADLSMRYISYFNSKVLQKETTINFNTNFNFSKTKMNQEDITISSRFSPNIDFNTVYRKYFNNKKFIEVGLDGLFNYYSQHSKNEAENDGINKINNISQDLHFFIPIKIGKGRIEQVQDARQSMYIFEELQKQKRIDSNIKKDDILELATFISKLKNKRFFDSRIRKAYELEAIDSLLNANNHITNADARYFTSLLDMWEYGDNIIRKSGNRISFAIYPGIFVNTSKREDDFYASSEADKSFTSLIINGGIEYKYEMPINNYWQHSFDFNAYAGYTSENAKNKLMGSEVEYRTPNIQFELSNKIAYYPNTRTEMHFTAGLKYKQIFDKSSIENEIIDYDAKALLASAKIGIYYYFSPQLRLSASSDILYNWQKSTDNISIYFSNLSPTTFLTYNRGIDGDYKKNNFVNYLSLSLSYSLF